LALFSRTAAISFLFWVIMLSRVMISHPLAATSGIQSVSSTSGLAMGRGGRFRSRHGTGPARGRRAYLTQPALTKQVRALERLVGAELIDRGRRPWRLTEAGEEVLAASRDLCARADQFLRVSDEQR
jgi:Bacterial regulatory helix-turn-helix protein, lysR family